MLVKFVRNKKEDWSSYLDTCVFAYNTSRHESSKFTPFQLMFGRRATLPIDLDTSRTDPAEKVERYVKAEEVNHEEQLQERVKQLEEAKENILVAQQKQKELYDRKRANPECYHIGALVLKKNFLRKKKKGGKLDDRYDGAFKITKLLPNGVYLIEPVEDPSKVMRVTGAHLKPYNMPDDGAEVSYYV